MRAPALLTVAAVLAAAIVQAAGQGPAQTSSADAKTGTIRGRITAADTGRPLRRAQVSIRTASESSGASPILANTNSLGRFEARNVPAGSYLVSAARAGYLAVQYGQRRPRERGLSVEVKGGEIAERIDLALPRGGVLSGRITDELGEPYPGVRVDALGTRYNMGRREPFPVGVATTDDIGQFRIAGLQPGSYYLVAASTETWRTEKKETYGYASTYFPGGPIDAAQMIALSPSEERADLTFSLHASRAARITGRLQRETGEPVAGGLVPLAYSYPGAIMTGGMRSVRTEADGSFEIKDVPGGVYSVGGGSAEQIVTVTGVDIEDLVLVAKTGSTVFGTVVTEDGSAPPFPSSGVRVLLEAPYGKVLPTVRVVSVDNDFSFRLSNLGGPFLFRIRGLSEDWMLASVRLGDKDLTDIPWDVPTGGREVKGVTLVVTQKIGRVSGMVLDGDGKPTAAATVLVFADEPELWMPASRFIRVARPNRDGRFSVSGLPPGTYRAVARDFVEDGQWEDRAFLDEVRADAARFVLSEGASEAITLKLPAAR